MPIYSAKVIKKPRVWRHCETCLKDLEPGAPTVRLYGCAESPDQPWVCYLCQPCADRAADVKAALNQKSTIATKPKGMQ